VLRAAGETETTQGSIQDWLELDKGDPGFQLLTEEEIIAVIYFYLCSSALLILLNFPFIYFLFLSLRLYCASLIRMTSHQLIRITEGLLYWKE
jgi:hypothetical protein